MPLSLYLSFRFLSPFFLSPLLSLSGYENKLVDDATQPEGVRSQPTKAELDAFLTKCQALNMWLISTLLDAKIDPNLPFNTQNKAICFLDAILKRKVANVVMCEDYFAENPSNLEIAADSV